MNQADDSLSFQQVDHLSINLAVKTNQIVGGLVFSEKHHKHLRYQVFVLT